jgi:hypothetical protein
MWTEIRAYGEKAYEKFQDGNGKKYLKVNMPKIPFYVTVQLQEHSGLPYGEPLNKFCPIEESTSDGGMVPFLFDLLEVAPRAM